MRPRNPLFVFVVEAEVVEKAIEEPQRLESRLLHLS